MEGGPADQTPNDISSLLRGEEGTEVTFLAWISSERRWAMIEYTNSKGQPVRAFVKGQYLACMK